MHPPPIHAQINTHICSCNDIIHFFFSPVTDRLWRSGKETDGAHGADRHVDRRRRRWHLAGGHHWITAEARSRRAPQSHNFSLAFRWWMFCYDRIKWVTYQSDSFLWARVIPWVRAFTSSVTTRSSKCLSCFRMHDLLSLLKQKNMKWKYLSATILNSYQRHHISDTVHPEGSNCTAGRAANQSEMLFPHDVTYRFFFERITELLSSCMTLLPLAFICFCF